jgi:flagellar motility protein MotE (MotC chaperone)
MFKSESAAGRPGVLVVVILCLALSGVLRLSNHGGAVAEEISMVTNRSDKEEKAVDASTVDGDAMAGNGNSATTPRLAAEEFDQLLFAIREREMQLEEREKALLDREQLLNTAQIQLKDQIAHLEDVEKRLAETIAMADGAAERDVARLTSVYENMKPKSAAEVFETMDVSFAAGFIARMRPDAAAEVLSAMSTDRAYAITAVMAGRNSEVPKE